MLCPSVGAPEAAVCKHHIDGMLRARGLTAHDFFGGAIYVPRDTEALQDELRSAQRQTRMREDEIAWLREELVRVPAAAARIAVAATPAGPPWP